MLYKFSCTTQMSIGWTKCSKEYCLLIKGMKFFDMCMDKHAESKKSNTEDPFLTQCYEMLRIANSVEMENILVKILVDFFLTHVCSSCIFFLCSAIGESIQASRVLEESVLPGMPGYFIASDRLKKYCNMIVYLAFSGF